MHDSIMFGRASKSEFSGKNQGIKLSVRVKVCIQFIKINNLTSIAYL